MLRDFQMTRVPGYFVEYVVLELTGMPCTVQLPNARPRRKDTWSKERELVELGIQWFVASGWCERLYNSLGYR